MSFDPQQWAIENPEEEPHSSVRFIRFSLETIFPVIFDLNLEVIWKLLFIVFYNVQIIFGVSLEVLAKICSCR